MAEEKKRKPGMGLGVSTRVENAWYVDPELLAKEEGPPAEDPFDPSVPPQRDETVSISEEELEEAEGELDEEDEDARHYADVSLRGALLARDDPTPPPASLGDRLRDLGERGIGRLSAVKVEGAPPPTPRRRPSPLESLLDALSTLVREASRLFEPGFVPPVWLALVAFLLGMGMTLLGVVIAL